MPARKYSEDLCNEAAELKEGGMSDEAIARKLGMSQGAVFWHCLRLGADNPKNARRAPTPPAEGSGPRGNHYVRRFTKEEDRTLLALASQGINRAEIARRMDRKPNSIRYRLLILARRDARREAMADT